MGEFLRGFPCKKEGIKMISMMLLPMAALFYFMHIV